MKVRGLTKYYSLIFYEFLSVPSVLLSDTVCVKLQKFWRLIERWKLRAPLGGSFEWLILQVTSLKDENMKKKLEDEIVMLNHLQCLIGVTMFLMDDNTKDESK